MHELPVIQKVLDICLKHATANAAQKIISIELKVGGLSDLEPKWMQRYFDFLSKDTIAQGCKLKINKTPVMFKCQSCAKTFQVDMNKTETIACPGCQSEDISLESGNGYHIGNMEVL